MTHTTQIHTDEQMTKAVNDLMNLKSIAHDLEQTRNHVLNAQTQYIMMQTDLHGGLHDIVINSFNTLRQSLSKEIAVAHNLINHLDILVKEAFE